MEGKTSVSLFIYADNFLRLLQI